VRRGLNVLRLRNLLASGPSRKVSLIPIDIQFGFTRDLQVRIHFNRMGLQHVDKTALYSVISNRYPPGTFPPTDGDLQPGIRGSTNATGLAQWNQSLARDDFVVKTDLTTDILVEFKFPFKKFYSWGGQLQVLFAFSAGQGRFTIQNPEVYQEYNQGLGDIRMGPIFTWRMAKDIPKTGGNLYLTANLFYVHQFSLGEPKLKVTNVSSAFNVIRKFTWPYFDDKHPGLWDARDDYIVFNIALDYWKNFKIFRKGNVYEWGVKPFFDFHFQIPLTGIYNDKRSAGKFAKIGSWGAVAFGAWTKPVSFWRIQAGIILPLYGSAAERPFDRGYFVESFFSL